MITVGLTGGIGAGKTYISEKFKKLNIPVYNSDIKAKELMISDEFIKKKLTEKFGENVYTNNLLNTKLIADKIFSNPDLKVWIDNLIHPVVRKDFLQWVSEQKTFMVIKEAAILIESGAYKDCDKIIVITAPLDVKISRVIKRDGMSKQEIIQRIQNQMQDDERLKYADFIIENFGLADVSKQVYDIYNKLIEIKKQ
jgi:dephospho-CoA kinase